MIENIDFHRNKLPVPRKFRRHEYLPVLVRPREKESSKRSRKERYIERYMPNNLKYLIKTPGSPFLYKKIRKESFVTNGKVSVPENFSLTEHPEQSYLTLRKLIYALLVEENKQVLLDYNGCKKIDLGSHVLLDVILNDYLHFHKTLFWTNRRVASYFPSTVGGRNITNESVNKQIFSVGSPVVLNGTDQKFDDVIKCNLCIHDNEKETNHDKRMDQKEIDTSELADYVVDCLARMNKRLTPEKLEDLCVVIGEMLINAEEHSTTKYRFSVGFFREEFVNEKHFGIFRLVILNFGETIYEKFSSEDCPNKRMVEKMRKLSDIYTRKKLWGGNKFTEESLWTLYALQEGVSSVSPDDFKRGNGSIRFIESFFNIKGSNQADDISNMSILSGNTKIVFDGTYCVQSKKRKDNEVFKVMTFNKSGDIEEKPDDNYVCQTDNYFPGTMISAKILLNDDDIVQLES